MGDGCANFNVAMVTALETKKYYSCDRIGNLSSQCRAKPTESKVGHLHLPPSECRPWREMDMMITQELLESDLSDDREQVLHLRVGDKGSLPRCMKGEVQGVPMYGIMDSGADITIIGDQTFKKVATAAKHKRRDFEEL